MILIVCLDDKNGMMFNSRRQSSDKILREHILKTVGKGILWMNEYSAEMFGENRCIKVHSEFLKKANAGEYCFVENEQVSKYINNIEKLIVYKWNRRYPADMYFDIAVSEEWNLLSSCELTGSSHEKITEEIYIK